MAETTVRELADVVGIPVDRLLAQLGESGLPHTEADQWINDQEKAQLFTHLRRLYGKGGDESAAPRKSSLKRKSVSELKIASPQKHMEEVEIDQDSGLEHELEDTSEIKRPFDPEKIKIRTVNIVVDQIVSRVEHEEIDLAPDFQRMAGIWNDERKSRLIESLLLRIPIPVFYVAADNDEKWSVVDGVQRTSTIHSYVTGRFRLTQLEYLTDLNGCDYMALPRPMQRRISETQLVVNIIEPETPEEVMFNIFRRINTGGMALNGQEIRHALHPGPVRDYLKQLVKTKEFLDATDSSIKKERMADRECVLRFLAFHIDPWEQYIANDLDGYLGTTMIKINRMDSDRRVYFSNDFRRAMRAASDIFGKDAFRKRYDPNRAQHPINKALFEVWSVGLARRSDEEISVIVENRKTVIDEFSSLLKNDRAFHQAISDSTGSPGRVNKRFRTIEKLIEECLRC